MAVDDHGIEALKKAAEEVTPGNQSDYFLKVGGTVPQIASTASSITDSVTNSEKTISSLVKQQALTITNLSAGKIHYSLTTGVSTSNAFFSKNDQLVFKNFNATVFLITASGTNNIQIDRFIKT